MFELSHSVIVAVLSTLYFVKITASSCPSNAVAFVDLGGTSECRCSIGFAPTQSWVSESCSDDYSAMQQALFENCEPFCTYSTFSVSRSEAVARCDVVCQPKSGCNHKQILAWMFGWYCLYQNDTTSNSFNVQLLMLSSPLTVQNECHKWRTGTGCTSCATGKYKDAVGNFACKMRSVVEPQIPEMEPGPEVELSLEVKPPPDVHTWRRRSDIQISGVIIVFIITPFFVVVVVCSRPSSLLPEHASSPVYQPVFMFSTTPVPVRTS